MPSLLPALVRDMALELVVETVEGRHPEIEAMLEFARLFYARAIVNSAVTPPPLSDRQVHSDPLFGVCIAVLTRVLVRVDQQLKLSGVPQRRRSQSNVSGEGRAWEKLVRLVNLASDMALVLTGQPGTSELLLPSELGASSRTNLSAVDSSPVYSISVPPTLPPSLLLPSTSDESAEEIGMKAEVGVPKCEPVSCGVDSPGGCSCSWWGDRTLSLVASTMRVWGWVLPSIRPVGDDGLDGDYVLCFDDSESLPRKVRRNGGDVPEEERDEVRPHVGSGPPTRPVAVSVLERPLHPEPVVRVLMLLLISLRAAVHFAGVAILGPNSAGNVEIADTDMDSYASRVRSLCSFLLKCMRLVGLLPTDSRSEEEREKVASQRSAAEYVLLLWLFPQVGTISTYVTKVAGASRGSELWGDTDRILQHLSSLLLHELVPYVRRHYTDTFAGLLDWSPRGAVGSSLVAPWQKWTLMCGHAMFKRAIQRVHDKDSRFLLSLAAHSDWVMKKVREGVAKERAKWPVADRHLMGQWWLANEEEEAERWRQQQIRDWRRCHSLYIIPNIISRVHLV